MSLTVYTVSGFLHKFDVAIPLQRSDMNSYNNVNTRINLRAKPLPHASSLHFASRHRMYYTVHWFQILVFLNVARNPSPEGQSTERHEEHQHQLPTPNGPLWV